MVELLKMEVDMSKSPEKESLIGVKYKIINGVNTLVQEIRYKDGTVREEIVGGIQKEPGTTTIFEGKDFPSDAHDLPKAQTSPLIRRAVAKQNSVDNSNLTGFINTHIDRSFKLHGMLLKYTGGLPEEHLAANKEIVITNSATWEIIRDLIDAVGDPWTQVRPLIIYRGK